MIAAKRHLFSGGRPIVTRLADEARQPRLSSISHLGTASVDEPQLVGPFASNRRPKPAWLASARGGPNALQTSQVLIRLIQMHTLSESERARELAIRLADLI